MSRNQELTKWTNRKRRAVFSFVPLSHDRANKKKMWALSPQNLWLSPLCFTLHISSTQIPLVVKTVSKCKFRFLNGKTKVCQLERPKCLHRKASTTVDSTEGVYSLSLFGGTVSDALFVPGRSKVDWITGRDVGTADVWLHSWCGKRRTHSEKTSRVKNELQRMSQKKYREIKKSLRKYVRISVGKRQRLTVRNSRK